ncbi:MAG: hypothetical protein QM767_25055 [Anaeromyxobacter sp.]
MEAATALVIDPGHAGWVKRHWGSLYLERENVFYRSLVIWALTSHARLTGSAEHLALLREQAEGLAGELEASPHGLLDDYPGQCFPADVMTAVFAIREADRVLGTDHSAFVERERRAFQGKALDDRALIPYCASASKGIAAHDARGSTSGSASIYAPALYPELARGWYEGNRQHLWQQRWGAVAFREFYRETPDREWYWDVDAGPVLGGHGFAASAFGLAAARANGRLDDAYPLTLELIAVSWPLPDGSLAVPRLISDATDAPLAGEAGILFMLTRPEPRVVKVAEGGVPPFVWAALACYLVPGTLGVAWAVWRARRALRRLRERRLPAGWVQVALMAGALLAVVPLAWWSVPGAVGVWVLGGAGPVTWKEAPRRTPG